MNRIFRIRMANPNVYEPRLLSLILKLESSLHLKRKQINFSQIDNFSVVPLAIFLSSWGFLSISLCSRVYPDFGFLISDAPSNQVYHGWVPGNSCSGMKYCPPIYACSSVAANDLESVGICEWFAPQQLRVHLAPPVHHSTRGQQPPLAPLGCPPPPPRTIWLQFSASIPSSLLPLLLQLTQNAGSWHCIQSLHLIRTFPLIPPNHTHYVKGDTGNNSLVYEANNIWPKLWPRP